ncbi:hypothetical protein HJC23_012767 [Cyclotella cryptica]|uniref:Uncharacterized protein n=1 Tax=Cyclotella cryptica TaxID=29204 RepID=A0ABD3Q339_9STRA|eukprot:CCRYP_008994-RA/>CCRYP_008994-RA protein AED:0.04 eAED:0.04 QI:70/1/1/1/1/1/3/452/526
MTKPSDLHGDGINFAFFELLWSKCSSEAESLSENKATTLRVPDTVIFLFGLPHQWYFTSKNGGQHKDKTTILRKRRANLTLENIEQAFLTKAFSRSGVGEDAVVAYFISSKNTALDNEMSCDIEYFNKESLSNFLHHGRRNKSGILQRFIAPHGGSYNSSIRAMWTPKMCILERRRTKQALNDKRFALFERAITFDGPDVHSVSVPLCGTVLAGRVENICDEVVRRIANVLSENSQGKKYSNVNRDNIENNAEFEVGRMAVNLKVDGNGKIWILWSNSIRLDSKSNVNERSITESASQPLNMNTIVKLPSASKLSQVPSHDSKLKLDNKVSLSKCPSCGKCCKNELFQKVPYKTVINHFDKTLEMLKYHSESNLLHSWPPKDSVIRAAGGVGFGIAYQQEHSEEAFIIPPVIRHIYPKLRTKGYNMYRGDSTFLQKSCSVCEDCFLAYATLTSNSYLMVYPVDPCPTNKDFHFEIPPAKSQGDFVKIKTKQSAPSVSIDRFGLKDFGKAPTIPPAILEPPQASTEL